MPGGRHSLGPGRRVALRDVGFRPRKAQIEFATYEAHLRLPHHFGDTEISVPSSSIAVVDLTAPGAPHEPDEIVDDFPDRAIAYLPTASPRRAPTTLLLFALPQPVPHPRRWAPVRPRSAPLARGRWWRPRRARHGRALRLDGLLLRADNPRWTADRFVAAGAMRGVHRDGGWYADVYGTSSARAGLDPAWARPSVDRLDAVVRLLVLVAVAAAAVLVAASATGAAVPTWGWGLPAMGAGLAVLGAVLAHHLYGREPEAQLRPDKPMHRVLPGQPSRVTPDMVRPGALVDVRRGSPSSWVGSSGPPR